MAILLAILKAASFYYYTIFDHTTNNEILNKITKKPLIMLELSIFTGKDLCQSLFFHKVAGLKPSKKIIRTPILQNTSGRLLLENNYQSFKNLFQIFLIHEFPFRKTGECFIFSLFILSVEKGTEGVVQRCPV